VYQFRQDIFCRDKDKRSSAKLLLPRLGPTYLSKFDNMWVVADHRLPLPSLAILFEKTKRDSCSFAHLVEGGHKVFMPAL